VKLVQANASASTAFLIVMFFLRLEPTCQCSGHGNLWTQAVQMPFVGQACISQAGWPVGLAD
jgi:hypothetical protein